LSCSRRHVERGLFRRRSIRPPKEIEQVKFWRSGETMGLITCWTRQGDEELKFTD
jgi:hypothetical protein